MALNVEEEFPKAYLQPRGLNYSEEDIRALMNAEPMDRLPSKFIPTADSNPTPPVLHFGYLPKKEIVLEYAKMYGLEKSIPGSVDDEGKPAAPKPNMYHTLKHVLQVLCKQHGLRTIKPKVQRVMRFEDYIFISFYTNYTPIDHRPPEEEVEKLGELLKVMLQSKDSESPRWYPDADEGVWMWRSNLAETQDVFFRNYSNCVWIEHDGICFQLAMTGLILQCKAKSRHSNC